MIIVVADAVAAAVAEVVAWALEDLILRMSLCSQVILNPTIPH